MRPRTMIILGAALVVLAIGITVAACRTVTSNPAPVSTVQQEEPDCNLDDILEKDEDCGFKPTVKPTPKLTKPPAPVKPPTGATKPTTRRK